ncbi:MAG: Gfo/Idh/MocA family oxidoreductase [Candidatus Binatia bacterium]
MKVGVVGAGLMGKIHLNLLREMHGVQIVGVADSRIDRAEALDVAGNIGTAFRDLETLLERARPDAVHIVTPPNTHAALAGMALRAGCHVFVEKPMALTVQEAQSMIAIATENRRILAVDHNHLFDPAVRDAQVRVAEHQLGRLLGLDVFHGALPASPEWLEELSSGPWTNDVDHLLYLAHLFMGDPQAIRAVGYPNGGQSKVTELRVLMEHNAGSSSLTYSSATAPFRIRLMVYGTERTLELDVVAGLMIEHRRVGGHPWLAKGIAALDIASQLMFGAGRNAVRVLTGRERSWAGLRALLDAFYEAIRDNGPSPVPGTEGLRIVRLREEISRQLKEQGRESALSSRV